MEIYKSVTLNDPIIMQKLSKKGVFCLHRLDYVCVGPGTVDRAEDQVGFAEHSLNVFVESLIIKLSCIQLLQHPVKSCPCNEAAHQNQPPQAVIVTSGVSSTVALKSIYLKTFVKSDVRASVCGLKTTRNNGSERRIQMRQRKQTSFHLK